MTNREWLESLSDKELAYVIIDIDVKSCQEMYHNNLCQYAQKNACEKCRIKWLKMERKENKNDK